MEVSEEGVGGGGIVVDDADTAGLDSGTEKDDEKAKPAPKKKRASVRKRNMIG